ncbi:MAG: hypothetical protein ACC608_11140 [Anaerofustis sp.]
MRQHARKLTALLLFIAIIAACGILIGVSVKSKLEGNAISIETAKIEIYQLKSSTGKRNSSPYISISLTKKNDLNTFSDAFLSMTKLEDSTMIPATQSNCDITIKYTKGSENNLYTDTYELWYDHDSSDMMILQKGNSFYQISQEESSVLRNMIENKQ